MNNQQNNNQYSFEGEFDYQKGKWLNRTAKYEMARNKAIEMIEAKKYGLEPADFWVLARKGYAISLIISHNGCLKINEKLIAEGKGYDPNNVTFDKQGFNNSLICIYRDSDVFEVGEVSSQNCQQAYPYAMALKRCLDRVILKKSKLAFSGIMSEEESDEFAKEVQIEIAQPQVQMNQPVFEQPVQSVQPVPTQPIQVMPEQNPAPVFNAQAQQAPVYTQPAPVPIYPQEQPVVVPTQPVQSMSQAQPVANVQKANAANQVAMPTLNEPRPEPVLGDPKSHIIQYGQYAGHKIGEFLNSREGFGVIMALANCQNASDAAAARALLPQVQQLLKQG